MPSWGNLNLGRHGTAQRQRRVQLSEPRLTTRPFIANERSLLASGVVFKKFGPAPLLPWHAHHPELPDRFETPEQCLKELETRSGLLRKGKSPINGRLLHRLALPPRHMPEATLANPLFYRWARIRFVAGCSQFFRTHPAPYRFVTLIPPAWFVPEATLSPATHAALGWCHRLRTHLNDARGVERDGWLIGGLHASFERSPCGEHTGYQFHFHCIVNEAMLSTIDGLRKRRSYKATHWVDSPLQVDKVSGELANLAGYLVKSYWSNRNSIDAVEKDDMVRHGSRLQGSTHTEALVWADGQSFGHTIMCYNCDLPKYVRENTW